MALRPFPPDLPPPLMAWHPAQGLAHLSALIITHAYTCAMRAVHTHAHAGLAQLACCCSVAKLCLTLCNPLSYSTPGFLVLHHRLEFAQTHVPGVNDATQPSHPLSSPLSLALSLFQHQVLFFPVSQLFTSGGQSWSFSFSISPSNEYSEQISFRLTGWISLQSKGFSRVFSTVQKHPFFCAQPSLWSNSHICT